MSRRPQATRLAKAATLVLVLAISAGAGTASAATQMFKCVIDKRTVYQQQACPAYADPAPDAASTPPASFLPQAANTPSSAPARPFKPASRPASSVSATPR
jgi:hypothetical protein